MASNLAEFVPRFRASGAHVAETIVKENRRTVLRATCEVHLRNRVWIQEIHEKPQNPMWNVRGCGLYLFVGKEFLGLVREAKRDACIQSMTELVGAGARRGRALALRLRGWHVNVNTAQDMLDAWQMFPRDRSKIL
jgi:dTDP-glucose pyrophosphorylase